MSTLAEKCSNSDKETDDAFDTFGKYIATEMRSMDRKCGDYSLVNRTKRSIIQVIFDSWDTVESRDESFSEPTTMESIFIEPYQFDFPENLRFQHHTTSASTPEEQTEQQELFPEED